LAKCLSHQYDDDDNYDDHNTTDWVGGMEGGGDHVEEDHGERMSSMKASILSLPRGTSAVVCRILQVKRGKREVVGAKGLSSVGASSESLRSLKVSSKVQKDVEGYMLVVDKFVRGDLEEWIKKCRTNGEEVGLQDDSTFSEQNVDGDKEKSSILFQDFERDGNMGMIKRLLPVMKWRKLRKISNIYSAITVQELSKKLGMEQSQCMEFLLQVSIKQNFGAFYRTPIHFTIDDEIGVIYFDEVDIEEEEQAYLEKKLLQTMELAHTVKDLDISMATSPRYQMNLLKTSDESKKGKTKSESRRSIVGLS
jgi:hypothetical protein